MLGGGARRAARYAIEAGDHAALRYAHAEAAHQYQVALELLLDELDNPARAAEVQYKLGSELYDLNRLAEARSTFEACLDGFRRLGDRQGQALAHGGIARLHQGLYGFAAADSHVDEADAAERRLRVAREQGLQSVVAGLVGTALGAPGDTAAAAAAFVLS